MPAALDDLEAQAALDAVLAAPPFDGSSGGSEGVWLRLWQILEDWYEATLSDMYLESPIRFWMLMIVLSLVAAVLIWHLSISLRDVYRSIRRVGEIEIASDVEIVPLSLSGARAALAGSNYRFAVELAWNTAATALGRRLLTAQHGAAGGVGASSSTSTRTPRQQARLWRSELTVPSATALDRLVRAHEQACYSGLEPNAELAQAAVTAAADLMELE